MLHDLEQNHDQNVATTEACDIVPHNKLLYKLGIEGMFKLGIHLFLQTELTSGVPQGSV